MKIAAAVLCAGTIAVGTLSSAAAFEKIALIDSLDAARTWDVETPGPTAFSGVCPHALFGIGLNFFDV